MRAPFALFLALLLASTCSIHAQLLETTTNTDDDGNVVVSVHVESLGGDDNMPFSIQSDSSSSSPFSPFRLFRKFRPFSLFSHQPRLMQMTESPMEKDPFPGLFENLFKLSGFGHLDDMNLENSPSVDIQVFRDDDDEDEPNVHASMESPFSRIFTRLSSILDAVRQQTADGQFQTQVNSMRKGRRLGGCTLLQACGRDIDSVCGYAKRINIAQAIPKCLASHRPQLSEQCGAYIDRFYGSENGAVESSESTTTPSETVQPEIVESVETEAEHADHPSTPAPTTPQDSCQAAASTLCPNLPPHNMVAVLSCLFRHRDQVPQLCLDHVKDTAAFNCAIDAEQFCPGVTNRLAIGKCLKPRLSQLSTGCQDAVRKQHRTAPTVHEAPTPSVLKTQEVAASAAAPAPNFFADHSVALGLGLGAFVVVAVVAIVSVARRRRRAPRVVLPVVSSVQLVNPSATA